MPVAGVGQGAQDLHGLVQVPAVFQQEGQMRSGVPVAGVGAGAQPVQVPAVGQQAGQPIRPVGDPGEEADGWPTLRRPGAGIPRRG